MAGFLKGVLQRDDPGLLTAEPCDGRGGGGAMLLFVVVVVAVLSSHMAKGVGSTAGGDCAWDHGIPVLSGWRGPLASLTGVIAPENCSCSWFNCWWAFWYWV